MRTSCRMKVDAKVVYSVVILDAEEKWGETGVDIESCSIYVVMVDAPHRGSFEEKRRMELKQT